MKHKKKSPKSGFYIHEVLIAIVAMLPLIGIGFYAVHGLLVQPSSTVSRQLKAAPAHKMYSSVQPKLQPPATIAAPVITKPDYTIPPVRNGYAPVISSLPTKEPVVFLGIDDGANKQAFEWQMMRDNNVKASLFLANLFIADNPGFFKSFVDQGSLIEDHTVNHKWLSQLPYSQQVQEICTQADLEQKEYGRRPILFRPPGGFYNLNTQRAAATCGMKAVVMWIAKANGGSMQYQIGNSLRPGDIVLMHFRPEFKSDMQAFLNAEHAAGLHTELLEDWLIPSS